MRPVRLVVNAQNLDTRRSGGAGTYAHELLRRLDAHGPALRAEGWRVELLNRPTAEGAETAAEPGGVRRLAGRLLVGTPLFEPARRLLHRLNPRCAEAAARVGAGSRVVHELTSYETHPLAGQWIGPEARLCVTVLDLQDLRFPQFFDADVLARRRRSYAFYRANAALFFAISEHTGRTLVEAMGVDPGRVVVTPLAGEESSSLPRPDPREEAEARAWGRYLIYPAKPWAHKNHGTLIRAMGRAADAARQTGLSLLLTGGMTPAQRAALETEARRAGVEDRVRVLDWQTPSMLHALLRHAEMLVFPSLFEGFGMPVLEAQALGCPVACSNTTSLPEVAGDAALLFDPLDPDAIARIIADVALGRVDRQALIDRGRRNVRRFTWDRTFALTLDGYRRLRASLG